MCSSDLVHVLLSVLLFIARLLREILVICMSILSRLFMAVSHLFLISFCDAYFSGSFWCSMTLSHRSFQMKYAVSDMCILKNLSSPPSCGSPSSEKLIAAIPSIVPIVGVSHGFPFLFQRVLARCHAVALPGALQWHSMCSRFSSTSQWWHSILSSHSGMWAQ